MKKLNYLLPLLFVLFFYSKSSVAQGPNDPTNNTEGYLKNCYQNFNVSFGGEDEFNMLIMPLTWTVTQTDFIVHAYQLEIILNGEVVNEVYHNNPSLPMDIEALLDFYGSTTIHLSTLFYDPTSELSYLTSTARLNFVDQPKPTLIGKNDGCLSFDERLDFGFEPHIDGLCEVNVSITDPRTGNSYSANSPGLEKLPLPENHTNPFIQGDIFDGYCGDIDINGNPVIPSQWLGQTRCYPFDISIEVKACDIIEGLMGICPPLTFDESVEICCNDCQPYGHWEATSVEPEAGDNDHPMSPTNIKLEQFKNGYSLTSLSEAKMFYRLMTIYGQVVSSGEIPPSQRILNDGIGSGVYVIQLFNEQGVSDYRKIRIY